MKVRELKNYMRGDERILRAGIKRAAACLLLVPILFATAEARVHRVEVDLTVQRCNASGCKVSRTKWFGTAVAIGRKDGREYLLTNAHILGSTAEKDYGSGPTAYKEKVLQIHTIKIITSDTGDWLARDHGGRDGKGTDGVDLHLLSVQSEKTWNSFEIETEALPAGGESVDVVGFPRGEFGKRNDTVVGYLEQYGIILRTKATFGESGGAIVNDGKLVGVVWGNKAGRRTGTFGTHSLKVAEFVRTKLGSLPGTPERVVTTKRTEPQRNTRPPAGGYLAGNEGWRTCPQCDLNTDAISNLAIGYNRLSDRVVQSEANSRSIQNLTDGHNELLDRIRMLAKEHNKLLAQYDGVAIEIQILRGLSLPIRIETSEGKVIAKDVLTIVESKDGRLEFKPIVLKFDEKILWGRPGNN